MIRISKDFVEKFFVRDNEIFNLAIDFEAFMWSLDNVIPNDDENDYVISMKKGTIHLTEPMYFGLNGKTEEENEFNRNLQIRSLMKLAKDILYTKYSMVVPISTHQDINSAIIKYNTNIKLNKKKTKKTEKKITLDEIILDDETKKSILSTINFVKNREKYLEIGCTIPKGILLVGKPGTGKSYLAEIIASEADYKFKFTCGAELLDKYVGSSAEKIRKIFDELKDEPSLLYIDEIDSIGSKRMGSDENKEYRAALNQLLTCMSDKKYQNVMIIGSTNIPEQLDPALIRSQRFDRIVEIKEPTYDMRIDLFKLYIGKLKHEDKIDYELLAEMTEGKVGADITTICNLAGIRAVDEGLDKVGMEQLLEEITMINRNDESKEKGMIKKTNKIGFSVNN